MCGRFTIAVEAAEVAELLGLPEVSEFKPRYNVAPTQQVLAARLDADGQREAAFLRWGLVPSWAADPSVGYKMINARAETVATKPSFRHAFRKQRCLIPADGFYEWKAEGKRKLPFRFRRPDSKPFLFAGLWERWQPPGAEPLETCTIITTSANAAIKPFHERMPVILAPGAAGRWLEPGQLEAADASRLLASVADDFLVADEVSPIVNSPRVDDARCIAPVEEVA